ncbi:MAG: hypothetical protein KU37_07415 [Sulfuricurvum sp. PC08-66]|nr:MAG: hypothetical protein KU37_07415 [Sulfuricurvum sp. PC08-66]
MRVVALLLGVLLWVGCSTTPAPSTPSVDTVVVLESDEGNITAAFESADIALIEHHLAKGASVVELSCETIVDVVVLKRAWKLMPALMQAGWDINCEGSLLWFSAMDALGASEERLEVAQILLKQGIDVDAYSTMTGETPLMRAAAFADVALVKFLLVQGVNVYAKDQFGRTALDYDSMYRMPKNPRIASMLRDAGLLVGLHTAVDEAFERAIALRDAGRYEEAYTALDSLAKTHKQKRFYEAIIDTVMRCPKPTWSMCQESIDMYTYLYERDNPRFVEVMVGLYEKMLPLASKDSTRTHGAFHPKSQYALYTAIEALYARQAIGIDLAHDARRLANLRRLGAFSPLVRMHITSSQGVRYEGEALGRTPFGIGRLSYPSGESYYGEVIDYKRHGKGKLTYANGTTYDGYFAHDLREGEGLFTDSEGALFLGTFQADTLQNTPTMIRPATR